MLSGKISAVFAMKNSYCINQNGEKAKPEINLTRAHVKYTYINNTRGSYRHERHLKINYNFAYYCSDIVVRVLCNIDTIHIRSCCDELYRKFIMPE